MKEITKITFYGKDFSPLACAEYSLDSLDKVQVGGEYLALLNAFCSSYETVGLLFPKNRELFNKYVGVFRIKELEFGEETYDVTLEISCRFDTDKKAFFLAAMLLCLTKDELHFREDETVNITFHQVMDIFLLFMFKHQLAGAAQKGIFRKYQHIENNDSRPRGTIDIARHIRENMGLERGSIAYHYRELTADNPVNRLILAAYKRLGEKYPTLCEERINRDESVYSTLKMLQTELVYSKINLRSLVKENMRPITHPYFSEYEDLRKTCLKILRDEGVSIFDAGSCEETEAIYFNITELWENYIEYQFRKLEPSHKFQLSCQEQKEFLTDFFAQKSARPDFLFKRDDKNVAILDAKFKKYWENYSVNYDFLIDDIFKCIRDKDLFEAQRTGVIFPTKSKEILISGKNPVFDLVGVQVPKVENSQSFTEWTGALDQRVSGILRRYLIEKLDIPIASQQ